MKLKEKENFIEPEVYLALKISYQMLEMLRKKKQQLMHMQNQTITVLMSR